MLLVSVGSGGAGRRRLMGCVFNARVAKVNCYFELSCVVTCAGATTVNRLRKFALLYIFIAYLPFLRIYRRRERAYLRAVRYEITLSPSVSEGEFFSVRPLAPGAFTLLRALRICSGSATLFFLFLSFFLSLSPFSSLFYVRKGCSGCGDFN